MDADKNTHTPNWYERHVLPYLIDLACGVKPVWRQRRKLVPLATGRVLEVGIGTGRNLEHYDRTQVKSLTGIDPGLEMHRLAAERSHKYGIPVELVGLSAERIPFDDASFDTVLVTYSLCTIPDPLAALREMRRVLKPGGRLIFCEHGLAPDASVQAWQHRLTPLWSKIAGGCHLDRDIAQLLRDAGFRSQDMQTMYLPGPRPMTYHYWGTAEAV
ncbi:MAG TPA: methyltransferase domain-containing protein [Noviherbaspirillum sp.]|uniref:class I SAM-dependent methyltransferase n=1 Tax=Noviherbaspirillum sp. TaxID=1926288 RepID=UPI002B4725D1|nr:methyltransferase domain-containing protein [Noviherbaspirillum sp.]HJV85230.1 methyltransferase domain-containing protein [Noviherbaspirillum sp.]